MGNNRYIGARYVPIFDGAWDVTKTYEPLTIVTVDGNSYTSKIYVPAGIAITNEMYWVRTGIFNAQLEAVVSDINELKNINGVTPEMFGAKGDGVTNDAEAFQLAVNSIMQTGGTILLSGEYILGSDITITRSSDVDVPITFLGVNKASITFNGRFGFAGNANDCGNLKFINVTFKDSALVFKCDRKLIRVSCLGCTFTNVQDICLATNVCQSMYFINCIIRYCGNVINGAENSSGTYDIKISHCLIEKGANVYNVPNSASYQVNIIDNCIEGLTGFVASFGVVRTCIIADNYFELNTGYIIFNDNRTNNAVIENNNMTDSNEVNLVTLPNNVIAPQSIKILNNNITDITGDSQIYSLLTPANEYTGLIIEGNNKARSDDAIRLTRGTKQEQGSEPFVMTTTLQESPT